MPAEWTKPEWEIVFGRPLANASRKQARHSQVVLKWQGPLLWGKRRLKWSWLRLRPVLSEDSDVLLLEGVFDGIPGTIGEVGVATVGEVRRPFTLQRWTARWIGRKRVVEAEFSARVISTESLGLLTESHRGELVTNKNQDSGGYISKGGAFLS